MAGKLLARLLVKLDHRIAFMLAVFAGAAGEHTKRPVEHGLL